MKFESYIHDVILGKKKGFFSKILKFFLFLFSFIFKGIVHLRNYAYDSGFLSKYRPPVPLIISIGNIVAGGTGKTPATLFVASEFCDDFKIAILSRGYRSPAEKSISPIVLSQGSGPLHPATYSGDEPYLISENFPKAIVIVGKDRHTASNMAARMGAQMILLDDGMQHRHLARDFEIVLIDSRDPFGQGHFLPRGLLRESVNSLSRADFIILNHVKDEEEFLKLKNDISEYSKAFVAGSQMKVTKFSDLSGNEIPSLKDVKIGLFCAIAKPEKFKETILNEEAIILDEYFIGDHLSFDPLKLEEFANNCRAKGAEMIVCTEKDQVKFPKYLKVSLPIIWVKVKLDLVFGEDEWKSFIQKAKKDIIRRI